MALAWLKINLHCIIPSRRFTKALYLLLVITFMHPEGCLFLCNRIPEGNMKPELNPTQAICPPEDPKPRAFKGTPKCPDIKNTIDCAGRQSYTRQILPSSRYYKE